MRIFTSLLGVAAVALVSIASPNEAQAQQMESRPGWSFDVAPYLWLPTAKADLRYSLPPGLGGRVDVSHSTSDYFSNLNAALAFQATARYDRFTVFTDFLYVSASGGDSRVSSVNIAGVPSNPISNAASAGTNSTLKNTIWSLMGGYTVAQGPWGNVDLLAGFRYFGLDATTDYGITATLFGPRGNAGPSFSRQGRLADSANIWNGIAGVRGRINLGTSGFFVPYLFDVGAGGSNVTWQAFSGIGYQTGWAGISLGYRYLGFQQPSSSVVKNMTLQGLMLTANFTF